MLAGHAATRDLPFIGKLLGIREDAPLLKPTTANFIHALIAVLAGNAMYFLFLPYLPVRARHVPFHMDLGMVVDLWFCLAVLGIVKTVAGWKARSKSQQN